MGCATIRQFLSARLIDEMHLVVAPVLLGGGDIPWWGSISRSSVDRDRTRGGREATHVVLSKRA